MLNLDLESERQTFLANAEVALCVGLLACTCTAWFTGIGNGRRRLHRWRDAAGGVRQLSTKSAGRLDVARQYAFDSSWSAPPPSVELLLEQALTADTQLQVRRRTQAHSSAHKRRSMQEAHIRGAHKRRM